MTHYFWRKEDLSASQQKRLANAHIPFEPHKIEGMLLTKFGEAEGYLFSPESHREALGLLGGRVARDKSNTNPRRVEIVYDGVAELRATVCCWSHPDIDKNEFRVVAQRIVLPKLGKDIVLHGTLGEPEASEEDLSALHLHLYSSPRIGDVPSQEAPNLLWGLPVFVDEPMFPPTQSGTPILDSGGTQVGELVGSHAYLYLALNAHGEESALRLFECFCSALLHIMKIGGKEPILIEQDAYEENRSAYASECHGRFLFELETKQQRLEALPEEISAARAHFTRLLEEDRQLRVEIPLLKHHLLDESGKYEEEYDELCRSPKILRAYIEAETLHVLTRTLYWRHPITKAVYEIGEMLIEISTSTEVKHPLKIFNLTRQVNGSNKDMHHPHISHLGVPCWGSNGTAQTFATLIARRELAAAVNFAVQFVETVNYSEAWGSYFGNWPLVPATRVAALEAEGVLRPVKRRAK